MQGIEGISQLNRQMKGLLSSIEAELYARPLDLFSGSTIGQHFRHIHDFFHALVRGLNETAVDYAQRDRDPRIESDPKFAIQVFENALVRLGQYEEQQSILVRADFSTNEEQYRPEYPSSLGRELTFVHDHAVHHLAMIKIALQQEAPHLLVDGKLGVAPSTLKYQAVKELKSNS